MKYCVESFKTEQCNLGRLLLAGCCKRSKRTQQKDRSSWPRHVTTEKPIAAALAFALPPASHDYATAALSSRLVSFQVLELARVERSLALATHELGSLRVVHVVAFDKRHRDEYRCTTSIKAKHTFLLLRLCVGVLTEHNFMYVT